MNPQRTNGNDTPFAAARNGAAGADAPPAAPPAAAAAVEPLLVDTGRAAAMCGVSEASWYRLKAAGKTPAPVRLGGKVLYRLADLTLWVSLGCPPRKEFEARKGAGGPR
jgi:predicted DNA-binding transcriptional regulator AlpA